MSNFNLNFCTLFAVTILLGGCHEPIQGLSENENREKPVQISTAGWTRTLVPFGKSASIILFGAKDTVLLAGEGVVILSDDKMRTWKLMDGGAGSSKFTSDGGLTLEDNYEPDSLYYRYVNVKDLCPVEAGGVRSDGRFFLVDSCENSVSLWSIPFKSDNKQWFVRGFGASMKQREESDRPTFYRPYRNITFAGHRIFIDARLPEGMVLLTTDDDGKNWYPFWKSNTTNRIIGIDFFNEETGLMLISNGQILKTDDRGKNWIFWSSIPADAVGKTTSIDFANLSIGFIVGEGGLILTSNDGGKTWKKSDSKTENSLFKVSSASDRKAWAVGADATVLQTNDGGINWQKIELEIDGTQHPTIYDLTTKEQKAWIVINQFVYSSP